MFVFNKLCCNLQYVQVWSIKLQVDKTADQEEDLDILVDDGRMNFREISVDMMDCIWNFLSIYECNVEPEELVSRLFSDPITCIPSF